MWPDDDRIWSHLLKKSVMENSIFCIYSELYAKSVNTEIFKFQKWKPVLVGGTSDFNWLLRKIPSSSKQSVVCDVSVLYSLFLMTQHQV